LIKCHSHWNPFSAEVAQGISQDSYGLIFGVNTFLALILQTILTLVLSDEQGFAFKERTQFFAYGVYFLILGLLFFTTFIHSKITRWATAKHTVFVAVKSESTTNTNN